MIRLFLSCLVLCIPLVSSATLTKNLSVGVQDTQVGELREFLSAYGYVVSPTGNTYDMSLKQALTAFQREHLDSGSLSGLPTPRTRSIINSLMQGKQQVLGASTQAPFLINLELGMEHPDAKRLQEFLNNAGFTVAITGPGSKGQETTKFGPATKKALARYQDAHAQQILAPAGLQKGTGDLYIRSRAFINAQLTTSTVITPKVSSMPERVDRPTNATSAESTSKDGTALTVSISAAPTALPKNGTSVISWTSKNATSCKTSNKLTGTSGIFTTPPLTKGKTYSVTCLSGSQSVTKSVAIKIITEIPPPPPTPVPEPTPTPTPTSVMTVSISASPSSITQGQTSNISWTSQNAVRCSTSNGRTGVSGSFTTPALMTSMTYAVTCVDASNTSLTREVGVTVSVPPPAVSTNFMEDPGFESGTSGFVTNQVGTSLSRTGVDPISGSQSLLIGITGYGDSVLWYGPDMSGYTNRRSDTYTVSARVKVTMTSSSDFSLCGVVTYSDNTDAQKCIDVPATVGDKGTLTVAVPLNNTKDISQIHVRVFQVGSQALNQVMMDDVSAVIKGISLQGSSVTQPPPTPNPDPTPNPNPAPNPLPPPPPPNPNPVNANGLVIDLSYVNKNSTEYTRFKSMVDAALAGSPDYGFMPQHAALMYKITGDVKYADYAIQYVENCPNAYEHRYGISCGVQGAEALIAGGGKPYVSSDSYLEVGPIIGSLAMVYDWCGSRMTDAQKTRWKNYANQAIYNVWHPSTAKWGGKSFPWSGWSIDNPGNNYYYSFVEATMYWGLASRDATLLSFVRDQKLQPLVNYYAQIPGGGSLEGTGYGAAHMRLFDLYKVWKDSTGEDLSSMNSHLTDSIKFWVHATTPSRSYYAPIGDLARSSFPDLFDYHRRILLEARQLTKSAPAQDLASWWLKNSSVPQMSRRIDSQWDLIPAGSLGATVPNESLSYRASGVGRIFARTGWDTQALWMTFVAGKFNESHAHQDQGSFDLANNKFLAVTNNIYTASGIEQSTDYNNVLRFEKSGAIIPQRLGTESRMTVNQLGTNGDVDITGNITPAYGGNSAIQNWTRNVKFATRKLTVTDSYSVSSSTKAIFQVNVPVQPVVNGNTVTAGALKIRVISPANPVITVANQGKYRVDIAGGTGGYIVELTDQ